MSLSFLQKKSWHTARTVNIRDVWHDEEQQRQKKEKAKEREAVLEREKEQEDMERAIHGELAGNVQGLVSGRCVSEVTERCKIKEKRRETLTPSRGQRAPLSPGILVHSCH